MQARELRIEEHVADGVIHVAGIAASLVAIAFLIAIYAPQGSAGMTAALAIYGICVVLLFSTSAAYHLIPHRKWKPVLQRFDHAAIFLKIAGTYTPLVAVMGGAYAYGVLAMVWAGAVAGVLLRLFAGEKFSAVSIGLYLVLGWASVLLVSQMFERLPVGAAILVIAGGLLYTVGVVFHV